MDKNDIKQMQTELENLKKDSTKVGNQIRYEFWTTKKQIPWKISGDNINPQPDINDNFFNWEKIQGTQFNFITPFIATIVVDSDEYRYWKVVRYDNNQLNRTFYFETDKVIKYSRNSFELSLKLDIYMSYSREIINKLKSTNQLAKFKRLTITNNMLSTDYADSFMRALANVDENVLNGYDTYKEIVPVPMVKLDEHSISLNSYPIKGENFVSSITYNKLNFFSTRESFVPNGLEWFAAYPGTQDAFGSVQYYDSKTNRTSVHFAKKYVNVYSVSNRTLTINEKEQREISSFVGENIKLNSITFDTTTTNYQEFNDNMKNSYFAVFRNISGEIDCYPLLGSCKANFSVPVALKTGRTPDASLNQQVSTAPQFNRIYVGYDTRVDTELKNDWESIYNDYVKNPSEGYNNKSFIGIYRGIIAAGKNSKLMFSAKKPANPKTFDFLNDRRECWYPEISRIVYKLNYNEFISLELNDYDGTEYYAKKFSLLSQNNIINGYVNLLQPICLGSTEIVPARFLFLGNRANNFSYSIPFVGVFLDGFQLFLQNHFYNNASYSVGLGGTLPTKTETYQQQLDIINQQKNAGVWSSVGNIFARPLNWLGASFGMNFRGGNFTYADSFNELGDDFLPDESRTPLNLRTLKRTTNHYNASIGGAGGFIGDGLNIWNTIKQADIAKRNIGLGYLTSTSDDMLSAIIQNNVSLKKVNVAARTFSSFAYKKLFNDSTKQRYINYFSLFGFQFEDLIPASFINNILDDVNNNNNIGYFQLDKDWCSTNLVDLSLYPDNRIKEAVLYQLSNGIRIKKYS